MKISSLTSLYRPHVGGVETMVEEMAKFSQIDGHEFNIITKMWPNTLPETETIENTLVYRTPSGKTEAELLEIARDVRDVLDIALTKTDVLHIVGMRRPLPLFGVMAAKISKVPVVSTVVGSEVPNPHTPASKVTWEEGLPYMLDAYYNSDVITAVSTAIADLSTTVIPAIKNNISVLPVGIDFERYQAVPELRPEEVNEDFIVSLRRLEHSKGVHVLIEAYAHLIQTGRIKDLSLVIAGDGPERERLEQFARNLGINHEKIRFLGSLSLDQAIGMMKTATMTVVPSLSEGGGLVNTEANAVGCPLIASDVGGIREYTAVEAALLVSPNQSGELANAIEYVYTNPEVRKKMQESGKIFAQSRDWSTLINRYYSVYEQSELSQKELKLTNPFTKKLFRVITNEA